jgi:hypothetical protein
MTLVWLLEAAVLFALYTDNRLVFITDVESVYCAVQPMCLLRGTTYVFTARYDLCVYCAVRPMCLLRGTTYVFTARYNLSPFMKQIHFILKGLRHTSLSLVC